jgi:hypothetical protein
MFKYILFNYLRKLGLIFIIAMLPLSLFAQNPVPNPSFENWSAGDPVNWITDNLGGIYTPVTQSTNSHSGTYAARLEVVNFQGVPIFPYIQSTELGFPVSQAYANFTGYYQFDPVVSSNIFTVVVLMKKNGIPVGEGASALTSPQASYTPLNLPINYSSSEIPDTALIILAITDTMSNITPGSTALVDDVELSGTATGIAENGNPQPKRFKLKQNYPNPFNPTTTIEFSIPQAAQVQLVVYNQLGEQVATLVNRNLPAGIHRIAWQAKDFPSGVYFYRIKAGDFSDTKKLILLK